MNVWIKVLSDLGKGLRCKLAIVESIVNYHRKVVSTYIKIFSNSWFRIILKLRRNTNLGQRNPILISELTLQQTARD